MVSLLLYKIPPSAKSIGRRWYHLKFICAFIITCSIVWSSIQPVQATTHTGHYILIKRSEQTLYYVKGKLLLKSFPVATGRDASPTPTGRFTVVYKEENRPFYKGILQVEHRIIR